MRQRQDKRKKIQQIRWWIFYLLFAMLTSAPEAMGMEIISPSSGTMVGPGETVTVQIQPSPDEILLSAQAAVEPVNGEVLESFGEKLKDVDLVTGRVFIDIPCVAIGETTVTVFGNLQDGVTIEEIKLMVEPNSAIDRLTGIQGPPQQPVYLKVGQLIPLRIQGKFSLDSLSPCSAQGRFSGITRDMTAARTGTTYQSDNTQIVAVSPDGLIQGQGPGEANIMIQNRGVSERIAVFVQEDAQAIGNHVPLSRIRSVPAVFGDTLVVLDGSQSSDPDQDTITFEWLQEDGVSVLLNDHEGQKPLFIAPPVSGAEVLTFSLTVKDSHGAMSLPEKVRVTAVPAGSQTVPAFLMSLPAQIQTGYRTVGTVTMSPVSPDNVGITLLVNDPALALLAHANSQEAGSESLDLTIPAGSTQVQFDLIGLSGGDVEVYAYSTGFKSGMASVTVSNP